VEILIMALCSAKGNRLAVVEDTARRFNGSSGSSG
jgi:hypothetical protein